MHNLEFFEIGFWVTGRKRGFDGKALLSRSLDLGGVLEECGGMGGRPALEEGVGVGGSNMYQMRAEGGGVMYQKREGGVGDGGGGEACVVGKEGGRCEACVPKMAQINHSFDSLHFFPVSTPGLGGCCCSAHAPHTVATMNGLTPGNRPEMPPPPPPPALRTLERPSPKTCLSAVCYGCQYTPEASGQFSLPSRAS